MGTTEGTQPDKQQAEQLANFEALAVREAREAQQADISAVYLQMLPILGKAHKIQVEGEEPLVSERGAEQIVRSLFVDALGTDDFSKIFEHANAFANFPFAGRVLENAAEACPQEAFAWRAEHERFPNAKAILKKAVDSALARKNRKLLFENAQLFADEPYAEAVLTGAAGIPRDEDKFYSTFGATVRVIADKEYVERVLLAGVENDTSAIFENCKTFLERDYAEKVLMAGATRSSRHAVNAILNCSEYGAHPKAKDILLAAIDTIMPEDMKQYIREGDINSLLSTTLRWPSAREIWDALKVKFPVFVLGNSNELVRKKYEVPWMEDFLSDVPDRAVDVDPESIFQRIGGGQDKRVTEKAIRKIADADPLKAFALIYHFKDEGYAEEILVPAAAKAPIVTLNEYKTYSKKPYAEKVAEAAAKALGGEDLFGFAEILQGYPFAESLFLAAAGKDPEGALKAYSQYCDQPWAREVARLATAAMPRE